MARKPVQFDIEFHTPEGEEGKLIYSKKLGEVHINLIKQILDNKVTNINKKRKLYVDIQKSCFDKCNDVGIKS